MRILITGANGLLGQKLVDLLSGNDLYEVIATGKGPNRNPSGKYQYETLDLLNSNDIKEKVGLCQPHVVINTAALTHVDDCETNRELCYQLNVEAAVELGRAAKEIGGKMIHISTDFIFDGKGGPYRENDTPNPISYYGESKLRSEVELMALSFPLAIVRTVLVYGISNDMSRSNIILWVKKSLEEKKTIQVVNDQWRTPTLAEDLAMGCKLIADRQVEGVFNIAGKDMLTPYEMALETANFFDLDPGYIKEVDGSIFQQTAKRPPRTGLVIDKAKEQLGYDPRTFTEGIGILKSQL